MFLHYFIRTNEILYKVQCSYALSYFLKVFSLNYVLILWFSMENFYLLTRKITPDINYYLQFWHAIQELENSLHVVAVGWENITVAIEYRIYMAGQEKLGACSSCVPTMHLKQNHGQWNNM